MNFRVLLNCVPTSTQLISASTEFFTTPSTLLKPKLEPKYHMHWAISQTFGGKNQSCLFCLKIGTHGILEVLIPNPHLDFWNSNPKIHLSESCPFCLKIITHSILRIIILIPILVFWIFNPKSFLGKFGPKISKLSVLPENGHTEYGAEDADSYSDINFLNFQS